MSLGEHMKLNDEQNKIANAVTLRMLLALLATLAIVFPIVISLSGDDGRDGRDADPAQVAEILSGKQDFVNSVKLDVGTLPDADWESDWFLMKSQDKSNSYKEVSHPLDSLPSIVIVQVKAQGGLNDGFVFHGIGSAQTDDDIQNNNHGGVVYAFNDKLVRLWAPMKNNNSSTGTIISINDGWGTENNQSSHDALVRVLVWK